VLVSLRFLGLCVLLGSCGVLAQNKNRVDALEDACQDKNSGDACTATSPSNKTFQGSCFSGAPPGVEHPPPLHCRLAHPGEVACQKKSENDKCSFSKPGEEQNSHAGTCFKTPHGTLMCRLGEPTDEGRESNDGILPPHLACKNLTSGDTCKTHGPFSEGICTSMGGAEDTRLHCRMVAPTEKACQGKKANDDCSFERGGPGKDKSSEDKESGSCVEMMHHGDESILLCKPNGRAAHKGGARLSSNPELSEKLARIKELRQKPNFRDDNEVMEELTKLRKEVREAEQSSLRGSQ